MGSGRSAVARDRDRRANIRKEVQQHGRYRYNSSLPCGIGPIDQDIDQSRMLYSESLGISFKEDAGGYLHTGALPGAKHFALWPLSQTAQSCWHARPDNITVGVDWSLSRKRGESYGRSRLAGISNAHQEQDGALGPNGKPIPLTGGPVDRRHIHSVDARAVGIPGPV